MISASTTYDLFPFAAITGSPADCAQGWSEIADRLKTVQGLVIAVELYPGADSVEIEKQLGFALGASACVRTDELLLAPSEIEGMLHEALGDDPVFGLMRPWNVRDFFNDEKLAKSQSTLTRQSDGRVLVIGVGASLVAPEADVLIYADLARWEIQRRQRAHLVGNLGADNAGASPAALYKRAFFVDWRVGDRLKAGILSKIDFLLDTNDQQTPKMITGDLFRRSLQHTVTRPFRVVPFFDPGPWGGQWMKRHFGLPDGPSNYAWCFDCVPEENSLLLGFGDRRLEIPALDLVLAHPRELLGAAVYEQFGAEFPIRFDYLDTMGGGNLSLQVHPLREYIRKKFGMDYTQDESYYMLDAGEDAVVFLGLKEGVDPDQMAFELRQAQRDANSPFEASKYVNAWPAHKHDHFLIPAGTIHCSGRNGVVLEISATPYIFTFKLWDWNRLGLDGKPRPIHLNHGIANIQWNRTTEWVQQHLIDRIELVAKSAGVREERTGLHESQFIETRRHWFTRPVAHDTKGTVNVLNLVEGEEALITSPNDAFLPVLVHYGETFIVPAAVGAYVVQPTSRLEKPSATLKAYVRQSVHGI